MSSSEYTTEEVVQWLRQRSPRELATFLKALTPGLADLVVGAAKVDPQAALRIAATSLRLENVDRPQRVVNKQFADEVEDVLGRAARCAALRNPTP